MNNREEYLDSILNLITKSQTRDDAVTMIYCFPVMCAVFIALARSILTLLHRGWSFVKLHEFVLLVLVVATLLVTTTPTAFIITPTALLRPKPYCGALFDPPIRVEQDTKFYVLTTGKPLKPGTSWLLLDHIGSEDHRVLSESCITGVRRASNKLEEHVLRAPHKSTKFTQFKRDVSIAEGILEFSRGRFYYVSDCLDVERLTERALGRFSPVSCTSGYVHSDQLSYTYSQAENE
jgi:hypothetical protein